MNWTAREMELSSERVELSHMVSATAGEPVRAGHNWNAGKGDFPEETTHVLPTGPWAGICSVTDTCADRKQHWMLHRVHTKLIRLDGSLLLP